MDVNENLRARRALLQVFVDGHNATDLVKPDVLEWEYTDNAGGKADEFRLTLADPEGKWSGAWKVKKGQKVKAGLECLDWFGPDRHARLPMGEFVIDETELSGPPDKLTVKAVSAAKSGEIGEAESTRGWESFTLRGIAQDIAEAHGLELIYDAPEISFGRVDQREETDLAFLARIASGRGVNLKAHSDKLVLFAASGADAKGASLTIAKRGDQFSPSSYSFTEKSEGTAKAAEVAYHDPEENETYIAVVSHEGGEPPSGNTLKLNERVESTQEAIQLGTAALRDSNQEADTADISIMGHPALVAGITVNLSGFGEYDGKYFVESATHKGAPYTTQANLRKTLAY